MNIEELHKYCMSIKGVTEDMPFNDKSIVYKIGNKIFCLAFFMENFKINIKCEPEEVINLRERFTAITPGYHMNKKHWITIIMDDSIDSSLIEIWIQNSYKLVLNNLPPKVKNQINNNLSI